MTTAAITRESSVEIAAPATPQPIPKIRMALPIRFITFMPSETIVGVLESFIARKSAELELNDARNGKLSAEIVRYVSAASITSASI